MHASLSGVSLPVTLRVAGTKASAVGRLPVHAPRLQRPRRPRRLAPRRARGRGAGTAAADPGAVERRRRRRLARDAAGRRRPRRLAAAGDAARIGWRSSSSPKPGSTPTSRIATLRREQRLRAGRAALPLSAAVDRRRGLPQGRGDGRRRGARRGAIRARWSAAGSRGCSCAASCSTRSARSAATTSRGPGRPAASPAAEPCSAAHVFRSRRVTAARMLPVAFANAVAPDITARRLDRGETRHGPDGLSEAAVHRHHRVDR